MKLSLSTGLVWGAGGGQGGASASHAAVLLPGFVRHGGVRGVQGRGEGAQEASQQREAQSTPGAEHGPAVPVADVLRYPEHVARVAGQLEIDASHARAQGDYAACSCQEDRAGQISAAAANISIRSGASFRHIVGYSAPHCPSVAIGGTAVYGNPLTSHEEEESGDILHQIMLLAAAQHAYDPAEQDD